MKENNTWHSPQTPEEVFKEIYENTYRNPDVQELLKMTAYKHTSEELVGSLLLGTLETILNGTENPVGPDLKLDKDRFLVFLNKVKPMASPAAYFIGDFIHAEMSVKAKNRIKDKIPEDFDIWLKKTEKIDPDNLDEALEFDPLFKKVLEPEYKLFLNTLSSLRKAFAQIVIKKELTVLKEAAKASSYVPSEESVAFSINAIDQSYLEAFEKYSKKTISKETFRSILTAEMQSLSQYGFKGTILYLAFVDGLMTKFSLHQKQGIDH